MQRVMLKSKIHRATVTDCDLHYVGSITIDQELLDAADIREHEQVHVVDVDNGARFETYTISGERGSGEICINGAAARLVHNRDTIIVISYAEHSEEPFGSYEGSDIEAIKTAQRFVKEAGCDAVKLERGGSSVDRARAIVDSGIPVMGHVGLTPQTATALGGYRSQGRTAEKGMQVIND